MKIGLQIPDFTTPDGPARLGADLATVARTADEGGFDFIAVMDHFFQIGAIGAAEREMLEAYTTGSASWPGWASRPRSAGSPTCGR